MICPACRTYTGADSMRVARHIMGKFDPIHIKWMEDNGLNPLTILGVNHKGDYKSLAEFLDKRTAE